MAGQSEVRAGGAFVELSVRSAKFNAGLRAAAVSFKRFGSSITAMGKTALLMDLLKLAPLAIFAKHASDVGSELADMADRTGMSIESLSALKFAAGQTGSTIEDLEKSVKKMQKAIADDASEEKFAKLGIDLKKIRAMNPEEQFNTIANAISKITDPTFRTAAAMEIFGKSGTGLLPMLIGGRKGIETLTARAKELGLVMSTEDARAAEEFGDALQTMKDVGSRAMTLLGSGLIPALKGISEGFMNTSKTVLKWISDNRALVVTIASGAAAFIALDLAIIGLGMSLSAFGVVLGAISSVFGVVGAGVVALVTHWKLLLAAVAGGFALKAAAETIGNAFRVLAADAKEAMSAIATAVGGGNLAGAFAVAAAFFKVEWARVFLWFRTQWNEISTFVSSVWLNVTATIAKAMTTLVGAIKTMWTTAALAIAKLIGNWIALSAEGLKMVGIFSDDDVENVKDQLNKMAEDAFGAKNEKQLFKGIDRETDERNKAIDEDLKARQAAILQGAGEGLKKAADDVKDAEKAFKDATDKIKNAAVGKIEDFVEKGGEIDPAGIGKAAAMGTFDAGMASRIFGAGNDTQKKQLEIEKKHLDELKAIRRELNQGGIAFG